MDRPVSAVFAAALGVPGQTRKEYGAKLCERSDGPAGAALPPPAPVAGELCGLGEPAGLGGPWDATWTDARGPASPPVASPD